MSSAFLLGTYTLTHRELIRFLRQRNRVTSALLQPIMIWFLFSAGFKGSFSLGEGESAGAFDAFFFPGTLVLITLFTAIFSTISVIEDRQAGFLQGVLVAPLPASAIVGGKLAGGTILALGQALVFYALGVAFGMPFSIASFLWTVGILTIISLALTGLGFSIAWRLTSTQGFHAIMMLLLMPMWLLSGAFFPADRGPEWLQFITGANPLTYGVSALRQCLFMGQNTGINEPALTLCFAISITFAIAMFILSMGLVKRSARGAVL